MINVKRFLVISMVISLAVFCVTLIVFGLAGGGISLGIIGAAILLAFIGFLGFFLLAASLNKLISTSKAGNWDDRLAKFVESDSPIWWVILFVIVVYAVVKTILRADTAAYIFLGFTVLMTLIIVMRSLISTIRRKSSNK